jgi:hypothetical protein
MTPQEQSKRVDPDYFPPERLRDIWANDYLARIANPLRAPLTLEDIRGAREVLSEIDRQYAAWEKKMVAEGRAFYHKTPEGKTRFVLALGEKRLEKSALMKAAGSIDDRISACLVDSRIPLVSVGGQTYLAGARGNSFDVIISEIHATDFCEWVKSDLFGRIQEEMLRQNSLC